MNGVTVEIGGSLREARRRLGLELSEVEAATLIRVRYLDALEHERFDDLPPGSYRIVFLREYAEFLGLDGRILADEYMLRSAPAPPEARPAPLRRRELGAGAAAVLGGITKVHVAVAAALVVFAVVVWQLGTGGSAPPAPTQPAAAAATPPVLEPQRAPTRPARRASVPQHTVVHRAAPAVLLLVAARGSCWLLVRRGSSTGAVVVERTLEQGQRVRFGLRSPLWIRLGAPWNLDASLGGKALAAALPAKTGDVVATASGLRQAEAAVGQASR